jgi:hypothetical protein
MAVQFTWQGRVFHGELRPVSGAASRSLYHLIIQGYCQGQLVETVHGWKFSNQKHGLIPKLSEYFGKVVNGQSASQ